MKRQKNLICESVLLYYPKAGKPFILLTDASKTALGACLLQEDEDRNLQLVTLASRTLKGLEVNYYTTEQELLAIVWSLKKFRTHTLGSKVIVRTDHQALIFLKTARFLSGRVERWALALQGKNIEIEYIEGRKNLIADALSRISNKKTDRSNDEALVATILACKPSKEITKGLKNLGIEQKKDPQIKIIYDKLMKGEKIRDFKLLIDQVVKGAEGHQVIYIPEHLLRDFIGETHRLYGHIGRRKLFKMITEDFYYPNLEAHVKLILKACDSCQRNKISNLSSKTFMHSIIPKAKNELLSIDFYGPLPTGRGGTKYILAALDVYTKFVQLYAIKKADTRTTIYKIFGHYILHFGKPQKIQSDHGFQFTAKAWEKKLKEKGIVLVFSSIRKAIW